MWVKAEPGAELLEVWVGANGEGKPIPLPAASIPACIITYLLLLSLGGFVFFLVAHSNWYLLNVIFQLCNINLLLFFSMAAILQKLISTG